MRQLSLLRQPRIYLSSHASTTGNSRFWIKYYLALKNSSELGEYYNLYDDLMQHWHNIAPGKILDIQYEDLLENFETDVKQLLAFCGLEFEANCLAFENNQRVVRTASSDQVRQGLYKSAAGRWKIYEQALAPLKASLRSYS